MKTCWQAAEITEPGKEPYTATCLLDLDHEGEHDLTPDSEITITFAPFPSDERAAKVMAMLVARCGFPRVM